MKTLPNTLTVFNATPHIVRFWKEGWPEPVEVEPDEPINATVSEEFVSDIQGDREDIVLVRATFVGNYEGREIIRQAKEYADVIVGSIIAAQAYPGDVVAMCPSPGYERVPPAEKRMRPDKFTICLPSLSQDDREFITRMAYSGANNAKEFAQVKALLGTS